MAELKRFFLVRSLAELRSAWKSGALWATDPSELITVLHRIQGTAATLDFKHVANRAATLRALLRSNLVPQANAQAELTALLSELEALLV